MVKEQAASTDYVFVMEPEHVNRLNSQYRGLRRQVYFFQSISVLFCVCCLLTVMYQTHLSSTCKGTEEPPKTEKQLQVHSLEELTKPSNASFTRLTVKNHFNGKEEYLSWKSASQNLAPDNTGHFTLDEDSTSLVVHHTGTYKVSLQITYRGIQDCVGEKILQHDIYHYAESYGRILLLTYFETVNFTSPYWRKSLFSEGVFHLEKGDKLKVWSNSLPCIDVGDKLPQKTYFVAYPHFST